MDANREREYLERVSAALGDALAGVVDDADVGLSEEADVLVVRASGRQFDSADARAGAEYLVEEFGLQHGLAVSTTVRDGDRVYTFQVRPGLSDVVDGE